MKTSTIFRTIAAVALFAVSTSGLFAQVSNAQLTTRPAYTHTPYAVANYDNTNTETATVGAEMPYYVDRDANVNGAFFNASTFRWSWTGISTLKDYGTSTSLVSGTPSASNFVVATMPAATGTATLKTGEISNPKSGVGCEDVTGTTVTITVVAKPTFSLTSGSIGACSTVAQNLDLTLTGTAPFYIDYTISAVGMDGVTAVGAAKTYNATLTAATDKLLIDPTQLTDVAGVAGTSGKYTVTVTKVWDTYSWKAINANALAVIPAVNTYDIFIYPTPATKPIQHIKNL